MNLTLAGQNFGGVRDWIDGISAAVNAVTSVSKSEVMSLTDSVDEAMTDVESTYRTMSVSGADLKFRMASTKATCDEVKAALGIGKGEKLADGMLDMFKRVRVCFKKAGDILEKNAAGTTIVLKGTTFRRANLMKYIVLTDFVVEYSGRLAKHLIALEANSYTRAHAEKDVSTKAEISWLETNFRSYLMTLRAINVEPTLFEKAVSQVPEINIDENTVSVVRGTIQQHKLDPLRMGIIPYTYNPIYYIRMGIANYEIRRYQLLKRRQEAARLQLALLISEQKGEHNPQLERQIAVYEDEVKELSMKIRHMEEEVGL